MQQLINASSTAVGAPVESQESLQVGEGTQQHGRKKKGRKTEKSKK